MGTSSRVRYSPGRRGDRDSLHEGEEERQQDPDKGVQGAPQHDIGGPNTPSSRTSSLYFLLPGSSCSFHLQIRKLDNGAKPARVGAVGGQRYFEVPSKNFKKMFFSEFLFFQAREKESLKG